MDKKTSWIYEIVKNQTFFILFKQTIIIKNITGNKGVFPEISKYKGGNTLKKYSP